MKRFLSLLFLLVVPGCGRTSPAVLVLTHVTVIDGSDAPARPDQTLVIEGGLVKRIGPGPSTLAPLGARVIEGRGGFVIPGLWDMHVHLYDAEERAFPMLVANGVVGVRSTGAPRDDLERLARWRQQARDDSALIPHIAFAGPVLDGPLPAWPGSVAVSTPEEGRRAVRELKQRSVDFIKVYDGLSREAYFAIADEARRAGLAFVGHVPGGLTAAEASEAGQRSIEHLEGILKYSILKTTLEPFPEAEADALFARFARNGTSQVPTLVTGRSLALLNEEAATRDTRLQYMTADWRRSWQERRDFFIKGHTPEQWAFRRKILAENMKLVGRMTRAGVPIAAGTDAGGVPYVYYGFSLHDELALLVEAGLTPLGALQAATRNATRLLGQDQTLGTLEPGKAADLILLDASPLEAIRNTRRIRAVVLRGRLLTREDLDGMLRDVRVSASGHLEVQPTAPHS